MIGGKFSTNPVASLPVLSDSNIGAACYIDEEYVVFDGLYPVSVADVKTSVTPLVRFAHKMQPIQYAAATSPSFLTSNNLSVVYNGLPAECDQYYFPCDEEQLWSFREFCESNFSINECAKKCGLPLLPKFIPDNQNESILDSILEEALRDLEAQGANVINNIIEKADPVIFINGDDVSYYKIETLEEALDIGDSKERNSSGTEELLEQYVDEEQKKIKLNGGVLCLDCCDIENVSDSVTCCHNGSIPLLKQYDASIDEWYFEERCYYYKMHDNAFLFSKENCYDKFQGKFFFIEVLLRIYDKKIYVYEIDGHLREIYKRYNFIDYFRYGEVVCGDWIERQNFLTSANDCILCVTNIRKLKNPGIFPMGLHFFEVTSQFKWDTVEWLRNVGLLKEYRNRSIISPVDLMVFLFGNKWFDRYYDVYIQNIETTLYHGDSFTLINYILKYNEDKRYEDFILDIRNCHIRLDIEISQEYKTVLKKCSHSSFNSGCDMCLYQSCYIRFVDLTYKDNSQMVQKDMKVKYLLGCACLGMWKYIIRDDFSLGFGLHSVDFSKVYDLFLVMLGKVVDSLWSLMVNKPLKGRLKDETKIPSLKALILRCLDDVSVELIKRKGIPIDLEYSDVGARNFCLGLFNFFMRRDFVGET